MEPNNHDEGCMSLLQRGEGVGGWGRRAIHRVVQTSSSRQEECFDGGESVPDGVKTGNCGFLCSTLILESPFVLSSQHLLRHTDLPNRHMRKYD